MLKAIKEAHKEIKKICKFINKIQKDIGKPKFKYPSFEVDHDVYEFVVTPGNKQMLIPDRLHFIKHTPTNNFIIYKISHI